MHLLLSVCIDPCLPQLPLSDDHRGGLCWANAASTANSQASKAAVWMTLWINKTPAAGIHDTHPPWPMAVRRGVMAPATEEQGSCYQLGRLFLSEWVLACPLWMTLLLSPFYRRCQGGWLNESLSGGDRFSDSGNRWKDGVLLRILPGSQEDTC